MLAKRLSKESGYSLVEVMVAMMLLALAIIPMVSMFDTALNISAQGDAYDTARSFARMKLEHAKGLSYDQAKSNFPRTGDTTPSPSPSAIISTEPGLPSGFSYSVSKRYLTLPNLNPGGATDTGIIEVKVTVGWGDSNSYSVTGAVAKGKV